MMIRLALLILLLLAAPLSAHEEIEQWDGDINSIDVPRNIQLFTYLRFTRLDNWIVATKIDQGDTHHIGTMTLGLTRATTEAGQADARAAAQLLFDMSQLSGNDERAAHLRAQRLILLDQEVTEETAAMITLIDIWLQNPMDGAGS